MKNIMVAGIIITLLIFCGYGYEHVVGNNFSLPGGNNKKCCSSPHYYDKSQFLYLSLKMIINDLNNTNKKFLFENCKREEFTRLTIDSILKIDLDEIVDVVLDRINTAAKGLFLFNKIAYENAIIITDENRKNRR